MPFMDYFDRCYVINLVERTDRRKGMERELAQSGISLESGKVEFYPAVRPESAGPFPSIGARGCFMSHLGVLREAKALGLRNVLVLEDDLTLDGQFPVLEEKLLEQLQHTPWDFAYFGHRLEFPVTSPAGGHMERYPGPIVTAHFYALNGAVIDRLLVFLETVLQRPAGHPDGGPMHVDGAFSTFRQQNPDVVTLVAVPSLGWQRPSRSDIYPNRWYDRWPLIREAVAGLRRCKAWWKGRR